MTNFTIITTLSNAFPGILSEGVIGNALKDKIWSLSIINLYDFGIGKHQKIDDTPYGGGSGMVIMADVLSRALKSGYGEYDEIYYFSPRGQILTQDLSRNLGINKKNICLICGRFEGLDQRVLDFHNIKEISIGDYILSNGDLAAMVFIDSIVRQLPGVLGNNLSLKTESFSNGLLEHDQYTKPAEWNDLKVPDVLLSGNHKEINNWREKNSLEVTKFRRPDLLKKI
jgi:tRNA (guanine37-N1)-methyltransferase